MTLRALHCVCEGVAENRSKRGKPPSNEASDARIRSYTFTLWICQGRDGSISDFLQGLLGILESLCISLKFYLFICFWLCWDVIAAWAFLQLWQVGGTLQLQCAGFFCGGLSCCGARALGCSCFWLQLLSSRARAHQLCTGSGALQHSRSLAEACGIQFPHRELNPGPLHWEHGVLATGPPGKSLIQLLKCRKQGMAPWHFTSIIFSQK